MGILNYLVLNKQLITGGHPSRDSFKKLSKKGVTVVINLLPSHQNFIDNEEFLEPLISTLPKSGFPPSIDIFSIIFK